MTRPETCGRRTRDAERGVTEESAWCGQYQGAAQGFRPRIRRHADSQPGVTAVLTLHQTTNTEKRQNCKNIPIAFRGHLSQTLIVDPSTNTQALD